MSELAIYAGNTPAEVVTFEQWLGRPVDRVSLFLDRTSWASFDNSVDFISQNWTGGDRALLVSIPLISKEGNLDAAANGAYNDHWHNAAVALNALRPSNEAIYIRLGWEMNGGWFPWSAQGQPQNYIAAWREFVDIFREVSDRFKFEWAPAAGSQGMDPADAYPGDDYVDVIGSTMYKGVAGGPTDALGAWSQSVSMDYGYQWQADFANAHNKPISFTEWGVADNDAGPYIEQMAAWVASHNTAYQSYWDTNSGYPAEISNGHYPSVGEAYRAAFSGGYATIKSDGQGSTLTGTDRTDLIEGGSGADRMAGGKGDDGYVVDNVGDQVIELPGEGIDWVTSKLLTYTAPDNVEGVTIARTSGGVAIGNSLNNHLIGGIGNDVLDGGDGNDILVGGAGSDVFIIRPGSGATDDDIMDFTPGPGGDVIQLNNFGFTSFADIATHLKDYVEGTVLSLPSGDIIFIRGVFAAQLTADNFTFSGELPTRPIWNPYEPALGPNSKNVYIGGTAGNDILVGTDRDNTLEGGGGGDRMSGGKGNDTYIVDSSQDLVIEKVGEGIDTVDSYLPSYTLPNFVEHLTLKSKTGATGIGNDLDNRITGGIGNDTLNGAGGNDLLIGGSGNDTFFFKAGSGHDVIADFEAGPTGGDVIQLQNYGFTSFNQIKSYLTDYAEGAVLRMPGHDDTVLIRGIKVSQLTADDFKFAGAAAPIYSISGPATVQEGGVVQFTITRSNDPSQIEQVSYSIGGTMKAGADYDAITGSVYFKDWERSKVISISTKSDNLVEGDETLTMTLTGTNGAGLLDKDPARSSVSAIVTDATPVPVYSVTAAAQANEGSGIAYTFTRTTDDGRQNLYYTLSGTATPDQDYVTPTGVVTFAAGQLTARVVIGTKFDLLAEGNETVSVNLSSVTGTGLIGSADKAVSNIIDYVIVQPMASGKPASYISGTSANDTLVGDKFNNYMTGGGGQDTTKGGAGDDTYGVESQGDVVVELANEGIDTVETYGNYTLSANVENLRLLGVNLIGTGNELGNLIIGGKGNDTINGKAGNDWLTGGAGSDTFIFENGGGHDVITDFVTTGSDQDFVKLTGFSYSTFAQIQADMTQVGNDVWLNLTGGQHITFLNHQISDFVAENFGYKTVLPNPIYSVSSNAYATEGGSLTFKISRSVDSGAQTLNFDFGGTAKVGDDYTSPGNSVTFAAGQLTAQVVVQTLDDALIEGNESLALTIKGITGPGKIGAASTATATIIDNEAAALPSQLPASGKAGSYFYGTSGNDTINGDKFNNYLSGGSGQDITKGGAGDDTYGVESQGDVVVELVNEGIDTVETYGNYTLSDNVENLKLLGMNQVGTGNNLANMILGGKGNDTLNGKSGNDWLTGGAGADTFVFEKNSGHDVITDFYAGVSGHDSIDLRAFAYSSFNEVAASLLQVGNNTQLLLSDGGYVTFLDVTPAQFTKDHFIL